MKQLLAISSLWQGLYTIMGRIVRGTNSPLDEQSGTNTQGTNPRGRTVPKPRSSSIYPKFILVQELMICRYPRTFSYWKSKPPTGDDPFQWTGGEWGGDGLVCALDLEIVAEVEIKGSAQAFDSTNFRRRDVDFNVHAPAKHIAHDLDSRGSRYLLKESVPGHSNRGAWS